MTDAVLLEVEDSIAKVTINRPNQRNAINHDVCEGMRDAFDRIESDDAIRVAILTGAGGMFCAGMDLKAFADGDAERILFGEFGFGGFVKRRRTKPVIAAVEGAALAGGFEFMLACDLVVAATDAKFGLPEAKLGLIAGAGGAMRLAQRIPRVRANEILLTGKPFNAATAMELGLLNEIVPQAKVMERALSLAASIAENAPMSVATSLELADSAIRMIENWDLNDQKLREIIDTADSLEGARAFVEKRRPAR
ncbi:crotonase/enoyl-CoA hydratase family protein [Actibacterium pelagium]|uniref:Carnitinyl-CoA dehydratase n=1 Tax=Actibacterium pelagium TaxID=2029103 RepID=A0A917EKN3_9RHOB|nr:crotonase/enoyl-CoA hydratase family protein [Actibacterium pelagium]GGE48433.1 carnitinyl-CoA dehydratase [Actibacterium pelagium]